MNVFAELAVSKTSCVSSLIETSISTVFDDSGSKVEADMILCIVGSSTFITSDSGKDKFSAVELKIWEVIVSDDTAEPILVDEVPVGEDSERVVAGITESANELSNFDETLLPML